MQEQPGRSALQNTCALRLLCLPCIGERSVLCVGGRKEEETGNEKEQRKEPENQ